MAQAGQRKCVCCKQLFLPDRRNRKRQQYCSATACRHASKVASQARWLAEPANVDYFRDPAHGVRVQAWRAAHPGYGRGRRHKPRALQDLLIVQPDESIEESANRGAPAERPEAGALQDLLNAPTPVLAGLIAHVFQSALQDDLDFTVRRLVQLGHDVINGSRGEALQEIVATAAVAPSTRAVQLG